MKTSDTQSTCEALTRNQHFKSNRVPEIGSLFSGIKAEP